MPKQHNSYDCGVFACQVMENLSRGKETFDFTQDDTEVIRKRMVLEIYYKRLYPCIN